MTETKRATSRGSAHPIEKRTPAPEGPARADERRLALARRVDSVWDEPDATPLLPPAAHDE